MIFVLELLGKSADILGKIAGTGAEVDFSFLSQQMNLVSRLWLGMDVCLMS